MQHSRTDKLLRLKQVLRILAYDKVSWLTISFVTRSEVSQKLAVQRVALTAAEGDSGTKSGAHVAGALLRMSLYAGIE